MNYPGGKKKSQHTTNYSNRGMTLEEDINVTNNDYLLTDTAIIHKKPVFRLSHHKSLEAVC